MWWVTEWNQTSAERLSWTWLERISSVIHFFIVTWHYITLWEPLGNKIPINSRLVDSVCFGKIINEITTPWRGEAVNIGLDIGLSSPTPGILPHEPQLPLEDVWLHFKYTCVVRDGIVSCLSFWVRKFYSVI